MLRYNSRFCEGRVCCIVGRRLCERLSRAQVRSLERYVSSQQRRPFVFGFQRISSTPCPDQAPIQEKKKHWAQVAGDGTYKSASLAVMFTDGGGLS